MRTRYGVSYWPHRFPKSRRPEYPHYRGRLSVDVAVVGGGLTGCAAAYTLAAAGIETALFEEHRIGEGATGRSTGWIADWLEPAFGGMVEASGTRAARRLWQMARHGALDMMATLRRLKVRCDLVPAETLVVASSPDAERRLRKEYETRRSAGLRASWLGASILHKQYGLTAAGAIKTHGTGHMDPYRACLGLARAAIERGAEIFEKSAVQAVRHGRGRIELTTGGGTLRAERIVVATGHPGRLFKPLARHFEQLETFVVLTPPLPATVRSGLGRERALVRDACTPVHFLRWTKDNRLMFAGADQEAAPRRSSEQLIVQRAGQLMYELSTMYPAISGIQPEYAWDAVIGRTVDGIPVIGTHRNYPGHLFALGHGHNGPGLAFLAGRILARQCLDQPQKGDELFGFARLI